MASKLKSGTHTELPDANELAAALIRPNASATSPLANHDHGTKELVVIVHGTFANPDHGTPHSYTGIETHWWKPNSLFAKALDEALKRHGSPARCNLTELSIASPELRWNGWSGKNSEVERRQGAYELSKYLSSLQRSQMVRTIHIVAHSHGGNVVRRALNYLDSPDKKIGSIVCMGTPFLHFDDSAAWRRWVGQVHWPMLTLLVALIAGIIFAVPWIEQKTVVQNAGAFLFAIGIGAAIVRSIWLYAKSSEASSQSMSAIAVQFNNDEAINLLRNCSDLITEPHILLRELLNDLSPPRYAEERTYITKGQRWFNRVWHGLQYSSYWLADKWNGPVLRKAEKIVTVGYRVPIVGGMVGTLCMIFLFSAFRPYRPKFNPFLLSRLPRLKSTFFHSMKEETEQFMNEFNENPEGHGARHKSWMEGSLLDFNSWKSLASGASALLYFVIYPFDILLGLPSWLGAVMTRQAILSGIRAAATSATGMDMLGVAFKHDRTGRPLEGMKVIKIPPEIEKEIETDLANLGGIDLASLRESLNPKRGATLLSLIERAFKDTDLLHAQYYQDPRLIDLVAQCISGKKLKWVDETEIS